MKEDQVKITKEEVVGKVLRRVWVFASVVSLNFSIDRIKGNDKWVSLCTGFQSYTVFQVFYQFLLPAAENLNYYHSESAEVLNDKKDGQGRRMKMLLLTLVRLALPLEKKIWPIALECRCELCQSL